MTTTINISAPASFNMISNYQDEEGEMIQQEHEVIMSRTNHHSATSHFLELEGEEHENQDIDETFGGQMTEGRNKKSTFYKGAAALGLLILGVFAAVASNSSNTKTNVNMLTPRRPSPDGPGYQPPRQRELQQQEKCSAAINFDFQYTGKFTPLATCSGSPTMFEMVYHGGPCPASQAGTSHCRDFNSGPPPQGSPKKVYVSVTDATSNDILYAGVRKSGEDFYVFNKFQTLSDKANVEIYTNMSRAELLQTATLDLSCSDPNVIYKTVGASQITGFDTSSNGRVSVLTPRSPPAKVTVTISAGSSNGQRSSSSGNLKLTSLRVSNGATGSPPIVLSNGIPTATSLFLSSSSSIQFSFDAHLFSGKKYQTTVAGTFQDDSGQTCQFEETDNAVM